MSLGAFSGVIAGLVWGIGARLAMRAIAVAGDRSVGFSLSGTFFILMIGIYMGMPPGLLYLPLRRWLPAARPARAIAFGALVLLLLALPFYLGPLREEAVAGQQALAIALFAGLLVVLGATIVLVHSVLERFLQQPRPRWAPAVELGVCAVPAAFAIVMAVGIAIETISG
jgi:hypothetical protein